MGDDELGVAGDADQDRVAGDGDVLDGLARKSKVLRQQDLVQAGSAAAQREQLADGVGLDLAFQDVAQVVGAADHGVHAKGVQQFPVLGVGGPGHGAVHTELPLGDLAGHQIVLVVAGHGHKGVTAGHIGGAQGVKADGIAAHHRDVQRVGQAAAQCFLRLNDGHLVVVGQQALGQIHAHLAAACNTNFHSITSFSKTECLKTACLLGQCPEHGLLGEHRGADGLQLVGLVVQHL